jgi:hypothetical protein
MEKIVAAAVSYKINDLIGCIDFGKRHSEIYEGLHKTYAGKMPLELVEGFLTDTGRFVDRYEAKDIAVAANQLIVPIEETYPALYSEDVW